MHSFYAFVRRFCVTEGNLGRGWVQSLLTGIEQAPRIFSWTSQEQILNLYECIFWKNSQRIHKFSARKTRPDETVLWKYFLHLRLLEVGVLTPFPVDVNHAKTNEYQDTW